LGIALALSGIPANAAWLGHYEMAIPAVVILFFVALVRGNNRTAAVALVCALALREDVGFHVATLLVPLVWLDRARAPSDVQTSARTFAGAAVLGSTLALGVQTAFLGRHDVFALVYSGDPPFAHLTLDEIGARLGFVAMHRPYLVVPALLALGYAAKKRDARLAVGWLAALPWIALQLSASHPSIARLYAHYPFPLVVSLAWPLIALFWRARGDATAIAPRERRAAVALTLVCIATSLFAVWDGRVVVAALAPEEGGLVAPAELARTRAATERFLDDVRERRGELGRVAAPDAVATLAGDLFVARERVRPSLRELPDVDAVLYVAGERDERAALATARANGLRLEERPPGQRIVLLR
jgi:hypothetical protein